MTAINVVFDFDGSLATSFVGGLMFRGYTDESKVEEASQRYRSEQTSLREYQEEVFDLSVEAPAEMSKRAAECAGIRPLAHEVSERVWESGGTVSVASAGLDFYIQPVLEKANLNRINIHSGKLISDSTELPPFRYDYPSWNTSCKGDWVTCKCRVINDLKPTGEVVFVGDGTGSDVCAATNAADKVFASGRLLSYCNKNGIAAEEFGDDFEPVLSYVESKTSSNGAQ